MQYIVRGIVVSALTGAMVVSGSGVASANESTLDAQMCELVAASQTRVVDKAARTVTTTDSHSGTVILRLPGELTTDTPVDTATVPAGFFKGCGQPLLSTRLTGAFVTSYYTGAGIQSIITIEGESAPKKFRFSLDLPSGSRASVEPDGTVSVRGAQRRVLGGFSAPWAFDANGNPVATSYAIDGKDLVQTIEHGPGAAYPIVADPRFSPSHSSRQ